MKKLFSNVMLVAVAAMAFSACQKQEVVAPETLQNVVLTFSSEKPSLDDETKTEWTGETIQWSEGDKIRVAYTAGGVWQNAEGNATADEPNGAKTAKIYVSNSVEAGETASFSVPGGFTIPTGVDLEFYGVYPSTAASDASMPNAPSVTVTIPAEQKPLANSFDSKADLMAAKSVSTYILSEENTLPKAIPLMWTRIVAHGHLTIKNLQVEDGEKLQTITLTADEDADMVGEHYLYLDTHNVEKAAGNNAANSLTVKADNLTIADGGNVTFWTCFLPCTWKSLDVVVETDKATYTRSIDLTGKEKTFKQNARNTLGINMTSAVREAKTVLSLPFVKDFSDRSEGSEIIELDGFSSIDGKVYNADEAIRLASGSADGSITTQSLDLSQNFHVIVTACGWDSGELKMTVSAGEQTENITLTTYGAGQKPGTWKDYVINFDPVGPTASVQFSAVRDTRYYIQKIQILEGHVELTPVLSATNPDEMSAEGGEGSFTYTLSNPKDGNTVSATENSDWIEILAVNQEAKTVSYNVAENTSEESRTATITLSYEGAQSVNVTVTQAGKPAEGGDTTPKFVKVTATPADWSGIYLIVYEKGNVAFDGSLSSLDAVGNEVKVTIANNEIAYTEDLAKSTFEIAKNGTSYSIKSASGSYIGRTATSNGLTTSKTTVYSNDISISNGTITIASSGGPKLQYYSQSGSQRFRYYATTQQAIQLYRLEGGESGGETPEPEQPATPELAVNPATVEVAAAGGNAEFSYTVTNPADGVSVEASTTADWISEFKYDAENKVTFTVGANTTKEAREATITLAYTGAESKTVTVKQAAAETTEPEDPEGETVEVTDVLTLTGLNVGTYNSYTSWSGKSFVSSAVYAGVSYNSNSSIQLKNGSSSGIVTTASGGTLKKVVVSWHSGTTAGRYITIYGSNTPYSSTSDLYGDNKGTSLGTIKCGTSTELVISGDYKYFGILANSAVYLPEIKVTWEASVSTGGETPDPTPDPDVESVTVTLNPGDSNAGTWTNSQKTSTASVGNVTFTALGTGGNDSKYYTRDNTWRFYTANTSGVKVSVPTGSAITKVVITVTKGSPSTPSGCTVSSANKVYTYTVSNSPTELSFFKSGSDNLQINKIEVTYTN